MTKTTALKEIDNAIKHARAEIERSKESNIDYGYNLGKLVGYAEAGSIISCIMSTD